MNLFAIPEPTTSDSQTILWKKFSEWLYQHCLNLGITGLVIPNDRQNQTLLIRAAAYNAYALATQTTMNADQLINPNEVQGETAWIRSIAFSMYYIALNSTP